MNQAKLDSVATELMQRFESGLAGERERLQQQQQTDIERMKGELEQMKLQSELSMKNVETASASSTSELRNTIVGLQNEVSIGKVQRESYVIHYTDLIQQLRTKQTEQYAISLKAALQERTQNMSSLTNTMKCMVDQIKGLQERLNIMESEQSPAISSPQSIPASTCQATPSASGN